jgi:hypothetical protein
MSDVLCKVPEVLTLDLATNDRHVKVSRAFRIGGNERKLGQKLVNGADLRDISDSLRATLTRLNNYVQGNPGPHFQPEDKTGYPTYYKLLSELRARGHDLHTILVGDLEKFTTADRSDELEVDFDTENDTIPIAFAHDGSPLNVNVSDNPSIEGFDGFWLRKFRKQSLFLTNSTHAIGPASAETFRALYTTDPTEWETALSLQAADQAFLDTAKRVWGINVGCKKDWTAAREAWSEIACSDNILLFFGHSDGVYIEIGHESKASSTLRDWFHRPPSPGSTLLIVNACLSLRPHERGGTSILSLGARPGFAGMVGTEAEISNSYALKCITRLINDLCFNSYTLGDAFDLMRADEKLFPLNLFYSCYGDRSFQLSTPLLLPLTGT